MIGLVDDSGRAILPIQILCSKHPSGVQIDAWIDTGFTGDLVLPESVVDALELEVSGSIDGEQADGEERMDGGQRESHQHAKLDDDQLERRVVIVPAKDSSDEIRTGNEDDGREGRGFVQNEEWKMLPRHLTGEVVAQNGIPERCPEDDAEPANCCRLP